MIHRLTAILLPSFFLTGLFGSPSTAPAETLLFEHFEGSTGGTAAGVRFSTDVVGFGGTTWANRYSGVFDGEAGSFVSYGTRPKVTAADFTVEAFIRQAAVVRRGAIASDWSEQGANRSWALTVLDNGGLRFDVSPDGEYHRENTLVTMRQLIRPNQWYHVAAVSRGKRSLIYVNHRLVARGERSSDRIMSDDNANLKIGNADRFAGGPWPFRGNIDEVRITPQSLGPEGFLRTREPLPRAWGPIPQKYAMPFSARGKEESVSWQKRARSRLLALVAAQQPRASLDELPLDLQLGPAEDRSAYTLYAGSFQGNDRTARRPIFVTVPKGKGPFPAMLCLHGHGGSREAVFDAKTAYHGFADRFARGGYVVLAPSFPHRKYAAMMFWDLLRCVDILRSRPEVDPRRMGVAGLSMGGEWAMWAAACDTRLRLAVISGWMCTTEGVFAVPNCPCWELPGLVGLMDICEVNLLIAPRPVLFESAARDQCFPIQHAKRGFARIRRGYRVFGAEDKVRQDVWPARHEWHGTMAYPWVDKILGGHSATRTEPRGMRERKVAGP